METYIYIKGTKYVVPADITTEQWATISTAPEDKRLFLATVLKAHFGLLSELQDTDIEAMYAVASLCLRAMQSQSKHNVDFEAMSFGQFVDLDVLASNVPNEMIVEITSRLVGEDTANWKLSKSWPIFKDYMYWRADIYKQYKNLFGQPDEDQQYAPSETEIDIVEVWYDAIMVLAGESFMHMDEATDKPFRQALNFLAWKKDKADKEAEQMKNIQQR